MKAYKNFLVCGLAAAASLFSPSVIALSLGDIQTSSRLGERVTVELELLLPSGETVEVGCVHLVKPRGEEDFPWVRTGSYSLRRDAGRTFLVIRSANTVNEPIVQFGVRVGCGFEVQRDYTLFLSPAPEPVNVQAPLAEPPALPVRRSGRSVETLDRPVRVASPRLDRSAVEGTQRQRKAPAPLQSPQPFAGDRLVLFGGMPVHRDSGLALSTTLSTLKELPPGTDLEALRRELRSEFRISQALSRQATNLLDTAEKLRELERVLVDIQQRTDRAEKQVEITLPSLRTESETQNSVDVPQSAAAESPSEPPKATLPETPQPASAKTPIPSTTASAGGEGSFYIALVLILAMVVAGLVWRSRRRQATAEFHSLPPVLLVDPLRGPETYVDPLDLEEAAARFREAEQQRSSPQEVTDHGPETVTDEIHSDFSVAPAVSISDQVEANPVMELADIMLSFGRVKGAAQALQEFVDQNPEETLKPWLRLMEVYRLGGMRAEFEQVAANLNQYFNVEVQSWDDAENGVSLVPKEGAENAEPLPIAWAGAVKKARSIESMAHICQSVIDQWYGPGCVAYLEGLLRDNRGGQRSGFTIEVVDEILFLNELQETLMQMDVEAQGAAA